MPLLFFLLLALCVPARAEIGAALFRHHFIAREMPGNNVGIGSSALADFDKDGDLDFVALNRGDNKLYLFEQVSKTEWRQHPIGEMSQSQLGSTVLDVDRDGWPDVVVGGFWFRNPGGPAGAAFPRYAYDNRLRAEIHDIVSADIDQDGKLDLVVMGDGEGCFWYRIPENPIADANWPRFTVTLAVRNDQNDIHGGFFPEGIGDLDGDGDPDIFLPGRWLENTANGQQWVEHKILFGRIGPWGLSARSVIRDLDGDGDADIVVTDCDGQNSGIAWLENDGKRPPSFRAVYLANQAPGTRGSFHSLRLADFDGDGDDDILAVEQEDPSILPQGAPPRWFIYENTSKDGKVSFAERVVLDARLGGHDAFAADIDGDGDIDIAAKIWRVWDGNGNGGRVHIDWLENLSR